jgi:hypothetical protein
MGRHPVAVVILHITYARTMTVDYSRFSNGRATWEACSDNLEKKITGTIPVFALVPRKTKKNLWRDRGLEGLYGKVCRFRWNVLCGV